MVKTKSWSYYEIEEERHLLRKRWWLVGKEGRVEIDSLQQTREVSLGQKVKKPKNILDFLSCRMRSGKMVTTEVKAIYQLKKIVQ